MDAKADGLVEAVSAGAPSPILHHVLWVQSDLIKHLSTSKVFSWATGLGAGVMGQSATWDFSPSRVHKLTTGNAGIEWLNDTTLELLFSTPAATLLGLSLLSKAGFDPGEGDDPLLERAAHRFPISLLPTESKEGVELLSGAGGAGADGDIKRKGRGGFTGGMSADRAAEEAEYDGRDKEKEVEEWNIAQGIDPHARIAIRYATEADKQLRQQAKQSEWYKRHGRTAGKERASQNRRFGSGNDDGGRISFNDREAADGAGGREFARRIGREQRRSGPYDRPRRNADDLDRELENMARRRKGEAVDDDVDMDGGAGTGERRRGGGGGGGRRRGGGGGGGGRERRGAEDLDKGKQAPSRPILLVTPTGQCSPPLQQSLMICLPLGHPIDSPDPDASASLVRSVLLRTSLTVASSGSRLFHAPLAEAQAHRFAQFPPAFERHQCTLHLHTPPPLSPCHLRPLEPRNRLRRIRHDVDVEGEAKRRHVGESVCCVLCAMWARYFSAFPSPCSLR